MSYTQLINKIIIIESIFKINIILRMAKKVYYWHMQIFYNIVQSNDFLFFSACWWSRSEPTLNAFRETFVNPWDVLNNEKFKNWGVFGGESIFVKCGI